jgi:hypothetical protein
LRWIKTKKRLTGKVSLDKYLEKCSDKISHAYPCEVRNDGDDDVLY